LSFSPLTAGFFSFYFFFTFARLLTPSHRLDTLKKRWPNGGVVFQYCFREKIPKQLHDLCPPALAGFFFIALPGRFVAV